MIKNTVYLFFALFLVSCYSDNKVPSELIQPDEMKNVLWDVMSAQTWANEIVKKDSSANMTAEMKVLSQKVFEIHKIDSARFSKSYNWYIKHPLVLKPIFDSMYAQKQRADTLMLKGKPYLNPS
jgi:hypothetical protein